MDNGEWPLHHIFFNKLRHFYRIHRLFIITFSTENDRFIITFFNGRRPLHLIFFNGGWLIHHYIFHEFKIDYFVVWDLWGKFFLENKFFKGLTLEQYTNMVSMYVYVWYPLKHLWNDYTCIDKLDILWTVL